MPGGEWRIPSTIFIMKYNAFVSYSHQKDSKLAPSLEKAFEKFAKPTFKRKALTIFRDTSDLSASPDLWGSIVAGLSQADYFIFLASPPAAKSHWCCKEIDYWKANKPVDHILIALTDGELVWDESTNDFDWTKTTSLPGNFSGVFKNEPLFVDFRSHNTDENLTLANPQFTEKVVSLAATLHGKTVADMTGESIKQHTRTIRIRNAAIIILSLLLVTSAALSIYAFQQKAAAEKQTNIALASNYASNSRATITNDPTISLRLAEYAYYFAKSQLLDLEIYEDQLIKSYYNPYNFYLAATGLQATGSDSVAALHEFDDRRLELDETTGALYVFNGDRSLLYSPTDIVTTPVHFYTFSPKGRFIIISYDSLGANEAGNRQSTNVYDRDLKEVARISTYVSWGTREAQSNRVKFDRNETRFIISGEMPGTSVYDTRSGIVNSVLLAGETENISNISVAANGNQVALAHRQGFIEVYNLSNEDLNMEYQDKWQLRGHGLEPVNYIKYSNDGRYLYTTSANFSRKWSTTNDVMKRCVQLITLPMLSGPTTDTTFLLSGEKGSVRFIEKLDRGMPDSNGAVNWSIKWLAKPRDTVAKFETKYEEYLPNLAKNSTAKKWLSPNGRYYATRNGLFNNRNELLIDYNETRYQYKTDIVTIGFSTDSKFFFLVDRIYLLDPEMILSRMNNKARSGDIAQLDTTTRKLYLIEDHQFAKADK
jgi:hypothetical protein